MLLLRINQKLFRKVSFVSQLATRVGKHEMIPLPRINLKLGLTERFGA